MSGAARRTVRLRARSWGRPTALALLAVTLAAVSVGCSGDGTPTASTSPTTDQPGGVVRLLTSDEIASWDPQRIGDPRVAALAGRTLVRTLTAYAPRVGGATGGQLVGDLATDTGTPSADLKSWSFTLRADARWQDGTEITCEDVRHGISRTFATAQVTGGSTDALALLAVPKRLDGSSIYAGPWATGPDAEAGKAAFEQAVTCDGATLTIALANPAGDFDETVSLPAFAPVKESASAGAGPDSALLSSGPYQLDGHWSTTGGTLVRNRHWEAASDPVRKAYPDRIVLETGLDATALGARILQDRADAVNAVSLDGAPLSLQQHISAMPALGQRALVADTETVDFLALNVTSEPLSRKEIRQALEAATNRAGYAVSLGGPNAVRPTGSVIPTSLLARATAHREVKGVDPAKARTLLSGAGVTAPVPLRVAYRSSPSADKAMAGLAESWREAGFAPQLTGVGDDYFAKVSAPEAANSFDVFWSSWMPSWGSASTVLPAVFDSSLNLTDRGAGRDLGRWSNPAWNDSLAEISATGDRAAREKAWAAADDALLDDVAYIALAQRYAVHLAGSGVRNLAAQPHSAGAVDLAVLALSSR